MTRKVKARTAKITYCLRCKMPGPTPHRCPLVTALCHGSRCDGCCSKPRLGCVRITPHAKKKGRANG